MRKRWIALTLASVVACAPAAPEVDGDAAVAADATMSGDAAATVDATPGAPDSGSPKAAPCASTFGTALTAAFGRLDGTVTAVVGPTDRQCTFPNDDHLVVQIDIGGEIYRVVVNVLSDGRNGTDTRLRYAELRRAAQGPAWAPGWHPGLSLDYARDLDAHSTADFEPTDTEALVTRVSDRLELGARVSAYATSSGGSRASSAHLVHRGSPPLQQDGALVIEPEAAEPLYLLFHFDGSAF